MGNSDDNRPRNEPLSDGGVVERRPEPTVEYRSDTASHEQPAIERHELPGTIPVGQYHEYFHADRWTAVDEPLSGDGPLDWLAGGERLVFDADVREPGPYDCSLRVAADAGFDGGEVGLIVDGDLRRRLSVQSTGGWYAWDDVRTQVELSAGLHTIALVVYGGGWKLSQLEFL